MRTFLFFICLLFTVSALHAQDTIVKRNDEVVIAKVLEVNQTQVKYKKFNFENGPLYIDNKSDIRMIRYANGLKDEFKMAAPAPPPVVIYNNSANPKIEFWGGRYRYQGILISEREAQDIMEQSKDIKIIALTTQAKKAKIWQYVGFAGIPLGVAAGYTFYMANTNNYTYQSGTGGYTFDYARRDRLTYLAAALGAVAITCPIGATVFKIRSNRFNTQAVRLYNQKF